MNLHLLVHSTASAVSLAMINLHYHMSAALVSTQYHNHKNTALVLYVNRVDKMRMVMSGFLFVNILGMKRDLAESVLDA
jgi:hypothetical protein